MLEEHLNEPQKFNQPHKCWSVLVQIKVLFYYDSSFYSFFFGGRNKFSSRKLQPTFYFSYNFNTKLGQWCSVWCIMRLRARLLNFWAFLQYFYYTCWLLSFLSFAIKIGAPFVHVNTNSFDTVYLIQSEDSSTYSLSVIIDDMMKMLKTILGFEFHVFSWKKIVCNVLAKIDLRNFANFYLERSFLKRLVLFICWLSLYSNSYEFFFSFSCNKRKEKK